MKRSCFINSGFTLLEVLVALMIFGVIAASLTPMFATHAKFNSQAEIRSGAIAAAQEVLDNVRLQDPATLPLTGTSSIQNVEAGDRTYQVTVSYCSNSAYCLTSASRHLKVDVSYRGQEMYEVETVYTQLR